VATFPWTGWQASSGFGGSFALDWVAGITGIRTYSYNGQERPSSQDLLEMKSSDSKIPDDYPNRRVIGMILENQGAVIRFFVSICNENDCVFQRYEPEKEYYELRYRFNRLYFGKPLKFSIRYEAESGYRGKQIWFIEKGSSTIKRIKPKSV
jgi:hypothetical protein